MPRQLSHRQSVCQCLAVVLAALIGTAATAQDVPGVQLAEVTESLVFEETRLNGTVNAMRRSRLSTSVAGLVDTINAEVGDTVARGDALIDLDDEQARHELASARAQQQEAEATLAEARRRFSEARSVGAGRNIAATEIRARESAVAVAEAALARTRAQVSRYRTALERHRIGAPFAGVISTRGRDVGEWVVPGDELMTLVDLDNLRLDFQVAQGYFPRLDDGSELLLVSGHAGEERVPLDIASRVPVTDSASRTFLLRATAPDGVTLIPGMAVQAMLRVSTGTEGLTVPRDALNRHPEGRVTVWIAEPQGEDDRYTVSEKRVRTGAGFRDQVEILDGLEAGQQVVSRGNESLGEGITVRISRREAR